MHFLSLLVRYFNEPYIQEFVDHYFCEGVDHIYILHDMKSTIPLPDSIKTNPRISIRNAYHINTHPKTNLWKEANEWYLEFRRNTLWFMYVDCDEFISTYHKNPCMRIRGLLKNGFGSVDCIKIPWVMMSCNNRETDPPSLLQDITHRWNHDLKHPHPSKWRKGRCRYKQIQVKSIFKAASYSHFNDHAPDTTSIQNPICINSVNGSRENYEWIFKNLREADIENAVLLCFHYRVISKESCQRKTANNGFNGYQCEWELIMESDHPDKVENHLRQKSIQRFGPKNYIKCPLH